MMHAEQSLRDGHLEESLAQLQGKVRQDPSNAQYRIFLFQLLALVGQWDRAQTQLKVLGDMDASTLAMVQTYREALRCEMLRAEIFAGHRSPLVLGDPPQWIALLMQALQLGAEGHYHRSQQLRAQAFEAAPTTAGTIDGQRFEWIADSDSRLGPTLEAIINGRYYWIPFHQVREIQIEKPVDLRDLVWLPAYFTWANGGEAVGLIPTRYPGSEASEHPQIRMSHKTEWIEQGADLYRGLGQRVLATDAGEYPLMDVRQISVTEATK